MASYTKQFFSGSTNGTPIPLTSTDSLGAATIHTCASDTNKNEIWLWGWNKSTAAVAAYIELGDTVSPIVKIVPAQDGLYVLVPGIPLQNAKLVRGYCSTTSTSALYVGGYVNRIA